MSAKTKALEGVLERVQGRKASRFQALIAGIGAAAAVYKLLRSGSDEEGEADSGETGGSESGADSEAAADS